MGDKAKVKEKKEYNPHETGKEEETSESYCLQADFPSELTAAKQQCWCSLEYSPY